MNKINEAIFFLYSGLKKDRWGAFETDEGGPEKHFLLDNVAGLKLELSERKKFSHSLGEDFVSKY